VGAVQRDVWNRLRGSDAMDDASSAGGAAARSSLEMNRHTRTGKGDPGLPFEERDE
jgi:hypothetical protein